MPLSPSGRPSPPRAALLLLAAAALAGRSARGEEGAPAALRAGLVDLGSPDAEVRARGLGRVGEAVAAEPALAARALPRLREELRARGPEERARVVRLLARWRDPAATRLWLARLDPGEDDRVIAAAADGVADRADDAEVERALLATLRAPGAAPAARALALEALGGTHGPAARIALEAPVPAEGWLEASGRALGLARRGGEDAVPALLALLDHSDPAPRVHAWEGLVRITGRRLPALRAPWQAWWDARAGPAAPPPDPPAPPADRYAEPAPAHVPTYYGVPIPRPRSHVVFCLDVSQSMWGPGIEQARRQLGRTVKDLPTSYAFDVIAFHERVMPWAGRLVRAHPVQKARVLAWLDGLETVSYTNLFDAVETAFGYAGRGRRPAADPQRLDAVFLLSDGAPNRGRLRDHDQVVDALHDLSGGTIPVHTIGAGEEVFPLLRRIAEATGGVFADAFEFDG